MAKNSINNDCIWPLALLEKGLMTLIHQVGFLTQIELIDANLPNIVETDNTDSAQLKQWFDKAAEHLPIDVEATHCQYDQLNQLLTQGAPAILSLSGKQSGFVVLMEHKWRQLVLIMPSGKQQLVTVAKLEALLLANIEQDSLQDLQTNMATLALTGKRQQKLLKALQQQQLSHRQVAEAWLIRLPVGSNLKKQLQFAQYPQKIFLAVGATAIFHLLLILSWYAVGQSVFQTNSYHHMYPIWALLLLSAIPFYYLSLKIKDRLSLDFGALMRKRMLDGLLKLTPKEVSQQNSGQFLGRVMDVEALEAQSFGMAFVALTALIQMIVALVVLSLGAGGWLHSLMLLLLVGIIGYLSYHYYGYVQAWMAKDRQITGELAENMVGHRTRLAQQNGDYHQQEDENLSAYTQLSNQLDKYSALVFTIAGRRLWLLLSLLVLYWAFNEQGGALNIELLSISIGGALLAAISLDQLANSIRYLLEAKCAWHQLQPLYDSASRDNSPELAQNSLEPDNSPEPENSPEPVSSPEPENSPEPDNSLEPENPQQTPLLQGINIDFSHCLDDRRSQRPILQQCNFTIGRNDKILLQGKSGAGKSTLAHILAGLYQPNQGEVKLNGLSIAQLGSSSWRQKVVLAPQFNKNYILAETLAFNLLMGRQWPPNKQDYIDAEQVCRALNLGDLIDRMPAGLNQMIGECGWNLSHGERSRIFVARALLQRPDLLILDESFASLDPENLKIALNCVMKNSKALLLAAHP